MLSIVIAILVAIVTAVPVSLALKATPGGIAWGIVAGLAAGLAVMTAINFLFRKKIQKVFADAQSSLVKANEKLMGRAKMLQMKYINNPKGLQDELAKEMRPSLKKAIEIIDEGIRPYAKWMLLVERQALTMKAQLYYQLQDFNNTDRCLEKALVFDPMIVALKMARAYKKGQMPEVDKLYKKYAKTFKPKQGAILVATYSWCLVEQKRVQDAVELLAKTKDLAESEILTKNWEHLANNRTAHFSNAGFGESWYSLQLEEVKVVKTKAPRQRWA